MLTKGLTIGIIGIVALFAVPIMPAVAEEPAVGPATEFQALSRLPDARRVELTVMTDEKLSAVEGARDICVVCVNAATIRQKNVAVFSIDTLQQNVATVRQRNN
jgi:hypothetical protein